MTRPLLFKISKPVSVAVITEGPNVMRSNQFIASLANHPTYTFLKAFFGDRFRPYPDTKASVYWTHLRKCFLQDEDAMPVLGLVRQKLVLAKQIGDKENKRREITRIQKEFSKIDKSALRKCCTTYLRKEILALFGYSSGKRNLVVTVGDWARWFFSSFDPRVAKGRLEDVIYVMTARDITIRQKNLRDCINSCRAIFGFGAISYDELFG